MSPSDVPDPHDLPVPLQRARALDGVDANAALYADWAERYDHDVFEVAGVIGTARIADLLAEHVPDRTATVLDLGCGTGMAGQRLHEHGFVHVDGVDLSPEMLAVAARRGVYRTLVAADLTVRGSVVGGYDASVAAGVFTTGHLGAAEIGPIAALVRPGGVVAWVVADPLWPSCEPALRDAGVDVRVVVHEAIRRDAPPEARLVVGVLRS